jgi:hypothetical protein
MYVLAKCRWLILTLLPRDELMALETSAAAIITRPPEILTCIKFVVSHKIIFLVFDSHTRPSHPDGAGLTFSTSVDHTASYLANLLAVDPSLLADKTLQWEAQLLAQFSGHVFSPKPQEYDLLQNILKSSLTIMELDAQNRQLKSENNHLQAEVNKQSVDLSVSHVAARQLENRISLLTAQITQYEEEILHLTRDLSMLRVSQKGGARSNTLPTHPSAQLETHPPQSSGISLLKNIGNLFWGNSDSGPHASDEMSSTTTDFPTSYISERSLGKKPESTGNDTASSSRKRLSFGVPSVKANPGRNQRFYTEPRSGIIDDQDFALQQQRKFDEEDDRLRAERQKLTSRGNLLGPAPPVDKSLSKKMVPDHQIPHEQGFYHLPPRHGVEQQREAGFRTEHWEDHGATTHRLIKQQQEAEREYNDMRHVMDPRHERDIDAAGRSSPIQRVIARDNNNVATSAAPPNQMFGQGSQRNANQDDSHATPKGEKRVRPLTGNASRSDEDDTAIKYAADDAPWQDKDDVSESADDQAKLRDEDLGVEHPAKQRHKDNAGHALPEPELLEDDLRGMEHAAEYQRKLEEERRDMEYAAELQRMLDAELRDEDYAIQQQSAFDREDEFLRYQHLYLVHSAPSTFDCSICFETFSQDYVASVDTCDHQFCRECIKNHITSRLEEHRFPILCPLCVTGKEGKPSRKLSRQSSSQHANVFLVITNVLAQEVGISERENLLWNELENAAFSIIIHCRG